MAKRVENILIIGLGGVGFYLAKRLAHEEHAVTIIERDLDRIKHADGEIDARLVHGDAMSFDCRRMADAEQMDYLIAVTDNDAVNILSARIGHRCGIPCKITRVRCGRASPRTDSAQVAPNGPEISHRETFGVPTRSAPGPAPGVLRRRGDHPR